MPDIPPTVKQVNVQITQGPIVAKGYMPDIPPTVKQVNVYITQGL